MSTIAHARPINARLGALEGLRGLAALIVVVHHHLCAFWPAWVFGGTPTNPTGDWLGTLAAMPPLGTVTSGAFAVSVFFLLSGFVLSLPFLKPERLADIKTAPTAPARQDLIRLVNAFLRRYPRLMLPILATHLLYAVLLLLGALHPHTLAELAQYTHSHWLGQWYTFTPHLLKAIIEAIWGTFFQNDVAYNHVTWTIQVELFGSWMVFALLAGFRLLRLQRWGVQLALLGLLLCIHKPFYQAFLLGMSLANLWHAWQASTAHTSGFKRRFIQAASLILLAMAVYLGGMPTHHTHRLPGIYEPLQALSTVAPHKYFHWQIMNLGALALFTALLMSPGLQRFFQHRSFQQLGRYSFALYLTHLAVLFGFTAPITLGLFQHTALSLSASWLISELFSFPVQWGLAAALTRWIDEPLQRWVKQLDVMALWQSLRSGNGPKAIAPTVHPVANGLP